MTKLKGPTPEQHRAAILGLIDERDRLRAALQKIASLEPGSRGAYTKFARAVFIAQAELGRAPSLSGGQESGAA